MIQSAGRGTGEKTRRYPSGPSRGGTEEQRRPLCSRCQHPRAAMRLTVSEEARHQRQEHGPRANARTFPDEECAHLQFWNVWHGEAGPDSETRSSQLAVLVHNRLRETLPIRPGQKLNPRPTRIRESEDSRDGLVSAFPPVRTGWTLSQ